MTGTYRSTAGTSGGGRGGGGGGGAVVAIRKCGVDHGRLFVSAGGAGPRSKQRIHNWITAASNTGSVASRTSSRLQVRGHYSQGQQQQRQGHHQRWFGSVSGSIKDSNRGEGVDLDADLDNEDKRDQGDLRRKAFSGSNPSLSLSLRRASAGLLYKSNQSLNIERFGSRRHRGLSVSSASLPSRTSFGRVLVEYVDVDMAISNFHIEFEAPSVRYKPGDELSGKVIMDVWASIDIKHVEFHITGKGTLRMFQNVSTFIERPKYEVYVDKNIILVGSSTSNRGITLQPGRYVTNFKYTLPDRVPPSVHQFDMGNGYIFDISYSVQARVCDFAHTRGTPAGSKLRIVKATRKSFTVVPLQDWHTINGAMEPTVHSDQLLLFCGVGGKEPTTVIVSMNRGIYPVGDNIRLTTEVISPGKDAIKDITAELEQQLFFDSDLIKKFRRVILKAFDDGRNRRITRNGTMIKSSFGISLPTNIIPSYLPNCTLVDLQYTMKVKIRFKKLGGKLVIRIPVMIAPACDSDRKDGDLPLFNKPVMQFPYFSKSPLNGGGQLNCGYANSSSASDESIQKALHRADVPSGRSKIENNVTTKYRPVLNCCGCCFLCLGFGILES